MDQEHAMHIINASASLLESDDRAAALMSSAADILAFEAAPVTIKLQQPQTMRTAARIPQAA